MSDHKTAFVPLATGYFQSPKLMSEGIGADVGLFAEALLYYDSVYVHVENSNQFSQFIGLLFQKGLSHKNLIRLVEEGIVKFTFTSWVMPFMGTNDPKVITSLYLMKETAMEKIDYFNSKFIGNKSVKDKFFSTLEFKQFYKAAENSAVNLSGDEVGVGVIDDAINDLKQPERYKLITKTLLDEHFLLNNLGIPPDFDVTIKEMDFNNLSKIEDKTTSTFLGDNTDENNYKMYRIEHSEAINSIPSLEMKNKPASFAHSPIVCAGLANLYIRVAETLDSDLYLPRPISRIVGNKIYESAEVQIVKNHLEIQDIIETLQIKVNFPDLRYCVNSNQIKLDKILEIRTSIKQIRRWTQEPEKDQGEYIARHNEVVLTFSLDNWCEEKLKILFGPLGMNRALYDYKSFRELSEKPGTDNIESFTASVGARLLGDWNPNCMGYWLKDEISKLLISEQKKNRAVQ